MAIRCNTYDKDHMYYGGIIYPSDFNTEYRKNRILAGSEIAKRIETERTRELKLYRISKRKTEGAD